MQTYKEAQLERALTFIENLPDSAELPDIVEWNEANRYVSAGNSPVYGPYVRDTAPHMQEILRRLSPDDPCNWVSLMKSVQSTGTFHAELAMAFWIKHKIGSIGFFTATKDLAAIRSSANIDVMIDDTGLGPMVKPHSQRNNRKKADSTFYKEFVGGTKLTISSYGSIAGMKSNTIPFIIIDEIDEAKDELKNQGDIIAIIEGRTVAVRDFKIFALSTPTMMEGSKIYRLFCEGDQRYYHVPCPKCGGKQVLVMAEGKNYGLTYELKAGGKNVVEMDSVRYVCKHCGGYFKESKKQWCLENGIWIPSAVAQNPKKHSYHVSGLLSPEQMLSWRRICSKHADTNKGKNILKYKDFYLNYKGWPWARVEKKADANLFRERNLKNYRLGEAPEGVLMPLAGIDVHKDRLECAVLGAGHDFTRWLIDYIVFYGHIDDPADPAWASLSDFVYNKTYTVLGREIHIVRAAIDCGYDPKEQRRKDWDDKSHTVYNFVGMRSDKFVPIRGSGVLKPFDIVKEARTSNPLCPKVYMLNTSVLKDMLSRELIREDLVPPVNFPAFMADGRELDGEFIEQFLSERYQEIKPGVLGWKKIRERNEVLDTWLYATSLGYYMGPAHWTETLWDNYRNELTI